jgi:hypothetical protein
MSYIGKNVAPQPQGTYSQSEIDTQMLTKSNSTDMTTALALKANLVSPTFTGTPTAPTASTGDSSTKIATTEFVKNEPMEYAQMPVGSVVQVVTREPFVADYLISTTTETHLVEYNTTINKKFSNSKIICFVNFSYHYNSDPDWWVLRARVNGTVVTSCINSWNNSFLTNNNSQYQYREPAHQMLFGYFWDTTNTSTADYTFFIQKSSTSTMQVWAPQVHMLTFMEIKQ